MMQPPKTIARQSQAPTRLAAYSRFS